LLRNVIARGIGVLVMLFGTYIVLRVAGLTQLALTVLGGTGLIGLAVGIAFRDITENFLASIFLSKQQPFATGDLIEVNGVLGFVQQLNIRTTVLAALDGTMVQIPNATVYKSNIRNLTINENRRDDFLIGIGYDDSIAEAQEVARQVLADHPTVLADPEPLVLVECLGKSSVNLRIYFWFNAHEHSIFKIRSSVIRLVKTAFAQHGISIPDEAREVVFPRGVPVVISEKKTDANVGKAVTGSDGKKPVAKDRGEVVTQAEAGLSSEASEIEKQARKVQPLTEGENLLTKSVGDRAKESSTSTEPPKN
jgi:small conductance mechanosensitive channel